VIAAPLTLLGVWYEPEEGRREKVGRLATKDGEILFEYDARFIETRLELSPIKLPLQRGVVVGDPRVFDGLMGVFEDSLPDGWGRLLVDRRAQKAGISPAVLGPLDRLALVGARSMGALVYEPEIELEAPTIVSLPEIEADAIAVLEDGGVADLERLIALGGSPQGARPKALVQIDKRGTVVYGDRRHRPGCTHYLVKFRAGNDELHAGALEHAYALIAASAGIEIPETLMLGRTRRHPGYFAIQRFDRSGTRKTHTHTLSGLLHASHRFASVTYKDLLLATRQLTRDETGVREMFRRACFNVFAHNRDDHARNFAFSMSETGRWRPSPAYDVTYAEGPGGEHAMLVGREGASPGIGDLVELASSVGIKRPRPVIDEVRDAVSKFHEHADRAGVPAKLRDRIASALGVKPPRRRRRRAPSAARR
jgi:serine/threonine-protein kinase HipA